MKRKKFKVGSKARVTRKDDSYRGRVGVIYEKVHCCSRMKFNDGTSRLMYDGIEIEEV